MGCGQSSEDVVGKQRNEEIENQLKKDKMMQRNEIKMLLLGMRVVKVKRTKYSELMHHRCWRVRKINHSQADEAHSRRRLYSR